MSHLASIELRLAIQFIGSRIAPIGWTELSEQPPDSPGGLYRGARRTGGGWLSWELPTFKLPIYLGEDTGPVG